MFGFSMPPIPEPYPAEYIRRERREAIAIAALQGMGTWIPDSRGFVLQTPEDKAPADAREFYAKARAEWAVIQADALIEALNKEEAK